MIYVDLKCFAQKDLMVGIPALNAQTIDTTIHKATHIITNGKTAKRKYLM